MIEQALRDPISVGMLALDGAKVMQITGERPGPRIGWLLHALLEEVLDDPSQNTEELLTERLLALAKLPDKELEVIGQEARERKNDAEQADIAEIHKKYFV